MVVRKYSTLMNGEGFISCYHIPSLSCLACAASRKRSSLTVSAKPLYAALLKINIRSDFYKQDKQDPQN